jgi:hypothetical protein
MDLGPRRFLIRGAGLAALAGGLLAGAIGSAYPERLAAGLAWGLVGWGSMAVVGLSGGAWTVARHGSPAAGFLLAAGTCMLARLILLAAGAFAAKPQGMEAVYAYLIGFGAAYLPIQVFEMRWFLRRNRVGA